VQEYRLCGMANLHETLYIVVRIDVAQVCTKAGVGSSSDAIRIPLGVSLGSFLKRFGMIWSPLDYLFEG
jgi:hypothetical protein